MVVVDDDKTGQKICGVPVVATADGFLEYVRCNVVDEVFINGNTRESSEALANELLELGLTVHFNLVRESQLMPNKLVEHCGIDHQYENCYQPASICQALHGYFGQFGGITADRNRFDYLCACN